MIIERVSRCMLCGNEITTEGTVLNQLCVGQINDLKMEHHMRTHHKRLEHPVLVSVFKPSGDPGRWPSQRWLYWSGC